MLRYLVIYYDGNDFVTKILHASPEADLEQLVKEKFELSDDDTGFIIPLLHADDVNVYGISWPTVNTADMENVYS